MFVMAKVCRVEGIKICQSKPLIILSSGCTGLMIAVSLVEFKYTIDEFIFSISTIVSFKVEKLLSRAYFLKIIVSMFVAGIEMNAKSIYGSVQLIVFLHETRKKTSELIASMYFIRKKIILLNFKIGDCNNIIFF